MSDVRIMRGTVRVIRAAAAAGPINRPRTNRVPTAWKDPITAAAIISSNNQCVSWGRIPRACDLSGENDNVINGRYNNSDINPTPTTNMSCTWTSAQLTPNASPKRMAVNEPWKLSDREISTTPSAIIPTNRRPMALSSFKLVVRWINSSKLTMTNAASAAPRNGEKSKSTSAAIPGTTPCTNASPKKLIPRSTSHTPTKLDMTAAKSPPSSARS